MIPWAVLEALSELPHGIRIHVPSAVIETLELAWAARGHVGAENFTRGGRVLTRIAVAFRVAPAPDLAVALALAGLVRDDETQSHGLWAESWIWEAR
jgi:hypothetical protein